jgi:type IV secretory pathway TrbD component
VYYVRMVYRPATKNGSGEGGRAGAVRDMFAYLGGAAAIVLILSATGWLPPLALLALVPLALKCSWAARSRDYQPSLRQVGFAELGHVTVFALLAIVTFALR